MKTLACEMCASNDIVKQDGMYVCQNCGTKYSVEEAKKLMIEGTVDVQGTVKVDNSDFVEKCLVNARRAMKKEDWEETEKYYNLVEQNDPSNIEAIFYSSYGKAKASLVDSDLYKRQAAFKVLQNCVSIIDDNFDVEKEEEQREIIDQISQDIVSMCGSSYVYNERKNGYGVVTWTDKRDTAALFDNLSVEFCIALENIAKKIPESDKMRRKFYYALAIRHAQWIHNNGNRNMNDVISTYYRWIHEIDPSVEIPQTRTVSNAAKQSAKGWGKVGISIAFAVICIIIYAIVANYYYR